MAVDEISNSTLYKAPVDPANWFGFRKDATALGYSQVRLVNIEYVIVGSIPA